MNKAFKSRKLFNKEMHDPLCVARYIIITFGFGMKDIVGK